MWEPLVLDARRLAGMAALSDEARAAGAPLELVRAARDGDREAFGELYLLYAAMVHGILLARLRPQEVPDLVQEVFLKAWARLGSLRRLEAFGGWLAILARTAAADHYRRPEERVQSVAVGDLAESLPGGSDAEPWAVLAVIRALPAAYAETLTLRLVEGLTGPEIAARTGLRPGSVRVNLHRGMKLLRRALEARP